MEIRYPNITVQLTGQGGNAFVIMGLVVKALRTNGVPKEERDLFTQEAMSGDYNNLLQTVMKWVNIE